MAADDSFRVERHGEVFVIVPAKDVESMEWRTVELAAEMVLEPLRGEQIPLVVIDLSEVQFFGSVFLSLLLRCWKLVASRDGMMVLCGASERARELLRLTALDTLWTIYDSRAEAIETLSAD